MTKPEYWLKTISPSGVLDLDGSDIGLVIDGDIDTARPASPSTGMVWMNKSTGKIEYYDGSSWNVLEASGPPVPPPPMTGTLELIAEHQVVADETNIDMPFDFGTYRALYLDLVFSLSANEYPQAVVSTDGGVTFEGSRYAFSGVNFASYFRLALRAQGSNKNYSIGGYFFLDMTKNALVCRGMEGVVYNIGTGYQKTSQYTLYKSLVGGPPTHIRFYASGSALYETGSVLRVYGVV